MRGVFIFIALLLPFSFSSAHETEETILVSITEQGFEPAELIIAPHTKIIFINRDEEGHWPASDRHPSHTDYNGTDLETHCSEDYAGEPVFDSCKPIEPGDTWSFVFEKAGTFHFHDHVWSHLGGTIVVSEPARPKLRIEVWLDTIINWFKNIFARPSKEIILNALSDDISEYERELLAIVAESDPRIAIENLRQTSETNANVQALCHDLLHEIGRASYQKYGSFEDTIVYQTDFCNSGYIHGTFEEYFETTPAEDLNINSLCSNLSLKRPFDVWQCNHGIGHGFMYLTGGDLNKSISLCDTELDESVSPQCHNGVYMELFNNEVLLHEPEYIENDNPFHTCDHVIESQSDCYLYAPTYFSQNLDWSFKDIFDICLEQDETTKLSCINGTASEMAKRHLDQMNLVFETCDQFKNSNERVSCVNGAASITVFQTASINTALSYCKEAGKYEMQCEKTVNAYLPMFVETY